MKYVCELCGRVYDETIGDPDHGIPADTAFADIPTHYACPVCGSEKEAFSRVEQQVKGIPAQENGRASWQYVKYSGERRESER